MDYLSLLFPIALARSHGAEVLDEVERQTILTSSTLRYFSESFSFIMRHEFLFIFPSLMTEAIQHEVRVFIAA